MEAVSVFTIVHHFKTEARRRRTGLGSPISAFYMIPGKQKTAPDIASFVIYLEQLERGWLQG